MKYFTDLVENKYLISEECDCRVYLRKKIIKNGKKKPTKNPKTWVLKDINTISRVA